MSFDFEQLPNFSYDLMDIQVTLLAYSENAVTGDRLATWLIRMPKYLLAELNTHRMLSRNAASSRAIPCKRFREYTKYRPVWKKNCPGMQGFEHLTGWRETAANLVYRFARATALTAHILLEKLGVHKQQANRVIEPYSYIDVIVSATDLDNFFLLRTDGMADDNFRMVAKSMQLSLAFTYPKKLQPGEWHLPLLPGSSLHEVDPNFRDTDEFRQRVVAQLARISYMVHGSKGAVATLPDDLKTYHKLAGSDPKHLSPLEHVAQAFINPIRSGNFNGFIQLRKFIPNESGQNRYTGSVGRHSGDGEKVQ